MIHQSSTNYQLMKNRKSTQTLRISILLPKLCVYIIRKQKQQAASQQYFTVILSDIYTISPISMFVILMKIVY